MLTLDSARLHYSHFRLFLAVDSDELLVPSTRKGFTLSAFRAEILNTLNKQYLRDKEEFVFFRRSAAALPPPMTAENSSQLPPLNSAEMITVLSTCMQKGNYVTVFFMSSSLAYSNSQLFDCLLYLGFTSRKSHEIAACFGPHGRLDKFTKYIDTKSTCSFHYLHECCDRDRKSPQLKGIGPMDITNKTWLPWSSSRY